MAARLLRGLLLFSIMMLNGIGNARAQDGDSCSVAGITTAEDLKNALKAGDTTSINVTGSIELELTELLTLGASHTLTINKGKTVTITGNTINIDGQTLTINGGGTLECAQKNGYALYGFTTGSQLTLENITVNITSGSYINVQTLTVGDGGTINFNSFSNTGIYQYGTLTINSGGTVNVGEGSGENKGIEVFNGGKIILESGGTLTGSEGGTIYLKVGSTVTGMKGKFSDQGNVLSSDEEVTVGNNDTQASSTGLTEGYYAWNNSTLFAKAKPQDGWTLDKGVLTISSDAGMQNWVRYRSANTQIRFGVTSATISDGVTKIVDHAFNNCNDLASVSIPSSVKTIGESAFAYSGIQTFTVRGEDNFKTDDNGDALLTSDGKELVAFASSTIGAYTIPDGVETLRETSFAYSKLTSVVIPVSVTKIGASAFYASALTSVTFKGDTPPTIGKNAFTWCDNLNKIIVPKGKLEAYRTAVGKDWADKVVEPRQSITVDGGTLTGDGQAIAKDVTVTGDVTFENVKTQETKVEDRQTSTLTLTGSNELGNISVGTGGSLTLDIEAGATVTATSVANSGTFTDKTGSVKAVTGDASLDLTGTGAMPSDQTAEEQVTLTVNPAIADDADVTYQWQMLDNGSWIDVSNPYTRAATTGNPSFKTSITGTYRCQIKVEKNNVSTTLLTTPATATVQPKSDPDPGPVEPPYVPPVYYTVALPAVEGAVTDPVAGDYDVESWSTFRFYLTLDEDYNQSQPVVTTDRGDVIPPRSSDGAYLVKFVRSDVAITISGVVKNPDPVANAEIQFGTRIFTRDGSLFITAYRPMQAQVVALTGGVTRSLALSAGTTRIDALSAGIYIVRLGNGMVEKVIIR